MKLKVLNDLLTQPTMLIISNDIQIWDAVDMLTKRVIAAKLVQTRGNQTQAARELGMNRSILRRHLTEIKDAQNS